MHISCNLLVTISCDSASSTSVHHEPREDILRLKMTIERQLRVEGSNIYHYIAYQT